MNNINNPSNISPSIDNPIPTRSDIYQTNYSTNPFDSNQNTSMNQPMTASNTTSTNYNLGVNNNSMTQGQTNVEEPFNQVNNNFNNRKLLQHFLCSRHLLKCNTQIRSNNPPGRNDM